MQRQLGWIGGSSANASGRTTLVPSSAAQRGHVRMSRIALQTRRTRGRPARTSAACSSSLRAAAASACRSVSALSACAVSVAAVLGTEVERIDRPASSRASCSPAPEPSADS